MAKTLERTMPELETRFEEAVTAFRSEHRHPANLALHAVGYALAARGAMRLLRKGRRRSGLLQLGIAAGILVVGHKIEGNQPFTMIRTFAGNGRR